MGRTGPNETGERMQHDTSGGTVSSEEDRSMSDRALNRFNGCDGPVDECYK